MLGSQFAPVLTPFWVYQHLVWGGLWALLFLLPLRGLSYVSLGIIYSLPQTLISLLVMMPQMHRGLLGLRLGYATPFLVLFFGLVWELMCRAVAFPSCLSWPSLRLSSWALLISVNMSTSFACVSW